MAATNALDHQADIAKVQELLGHANLLLRGFMIIAKLDQRIAQRLRLYIDCALLPIDEGIFTTDQ